MFKNLTFFKITGLPEFSILESDLAAAQFIECTPNQEKSTGFVPARGSSHDAYVESISGQLIAKFITEKRTVPAEQVKKLVEEKAKAIEESTGRKPGKKERRELKEDAHAELMPKAFSKRTAIMIWIDPVAQMLYLDTSSSSRADDVIVALIGACDGLSITHVQTHVSPMSAMTEWLRDQESLPSEFSMGRDCRLIACDETQRVVTYKNYHLDIDQVRQNIASGSVANYVAMFHDDTVSFVLSDTLKLSKIKILDIAFDGVKSEDKGAFDTDVAITTGELSPLVNRLIQSMGGYLEVGEAA